MMGSALIGKPVTHSVGQYIYNRLFDKYDIDSIYLSIDLDPENIQRFIDYSKRNFIGFNITAPYKEIIMPYLDDVDISAKNIGAVNMVKNLFGKLYGYNSDYEGFLFLLKNNNVNPDNKNILLLGTGGIARTAVYALQNFKCSIDEASRNPNAKKFELFDNVIPYDSIKNNYDIIINCTPVGTYPDKNIPINPELIDENTTGIDVVYNPVKTPFLNAIENKHGKIVSGVDLFIGQGIDTLKKIYDLDVSYDDFKKLFYEKINK